MIERLIEIEVQPQYLYELATGRGDEDTRTEVVLVLPRPGNRVLLITKPFYPEGTFRMPSGGVKPGESPEEAFTREAMEETGLEVRPERKLAVVTFRFTAGSESIIITSHVFLGPLTSDPPHAIDEAEDISSYREAEVSDIPGIARHLASIEGKWRDWGRFRAPAHEVAADYLCDHRSE